MCVCVCVRVCIYMCIHICIYYLLLDVDDAGSQVGGLLRSLDGLQVGQQVGNWNKTRKVAI